MIDAATSTFRAAFKRNLFDWLQLEDRSCENVADDEPLFGGGLGLRSPDALEIVVMLQRRYGITQREVGARREIFSTLATLCDFVQARMEKN